MEDRNLLQLVVFENLKVFLFERRDWRTAAVGHGGEDVHQLYIHFEGLLVGLFALTGVRLLLLWLLRLVGRDERPWSSAVAARNPAGVGPWFARAHRLHKAQWRESSHRETPTVEVSYSAEKAFAELKHRLSYFDVLWPARGISGGNGSPSDHTAPSSKYSFFQIGTVVFKVSMSPAAGVEGRRSMCRRNCNIDAAFADL